MEAQPQKTITQDNMVFITAGGVVIDTQTKYLVKRPITERGICNGDNTKVYPLRIGNRWRVDEVQRNKKACPDGKACRGKDSHANISELWERTPSAKGSRLSDGRVRTMCSYSLYI